MERDRWRLLEIDVESYAEATMTLSPAIARACGEGKVPETLAMYTHRKPSIVMGRQNDPAVDVNYPYCAKEGIVVKRVPTPGTIFGHPGYAMNVLYIRKDRVPDRIADVFALINNQLAAAFSGLGLVARHRPLNDLEVQIGEGWKKIGPFSISFFGSCICCRMGLTVSPIPFNVVENAVPGPPEKFSDKEAKSVTARVGSLEEALGRPVEMGEVKGVVRQALSRLFEVELAAGELSPLEVEYDRELREHYDTDEWFWANSVPRRFPNRPAGTTLHELARKIPQGPLVRARVLRAADRILDVSLTGWFHGVRPLDALEKIEAVLADTPRVEDEVRRRIERVYGQGELEIGNCGPGDLAGIILEAAERPPL